MRPHLFIRRYLAAGLLVWLPIWATVLVIHFLVGIFDGALNYLPEHYRPDTLLGFHVPGLGVLITILLLFFTGMLVTNFLGRRLVRFWESILHQIPLVRSIHKSVKQVLETIMSTGADSFNKVLLIQYPREGLWSIAFQTATGNEITDKSAGDELVTVFVPTTPNPTSGYLILVPRKDAREIDMSVEQALKMVISLGVMQPNGESPTSISSENT